MLIFDVLIHVGDHIYVSGDLISVVYVCQKYSKVLLELQNIFLYAIFFIFLLWADKLSFVF